MKITKAKTKSVEKLEVSVYVQGQETVREVWQTDSDGRNGQEVKVKVISPDVVFKKFVVKDLDEARQKIADIINYRRTDKIEAVEFESTDEEILKFVKILISGTYFEIVEGIEVVIPVADRKRMYKNLIRSKAMDQSIKKLTKIEIRKIY